MSLAIELQKEAYTKLLDAIKLYRFLYDFGIVDHSDPEAEAFWLSHRHLLPRINGTYDEYDPVKLNAMAGKQWRTVWKCISDFG